MNAALWLSSEYHLSGRPLVNKDLFIDKDSSAFGKAFPLNQNNLVPQPKRESYAQPQRT